MNKATLMAAAVVFLTPPAVAQTTIDLSIDDARALATRALFSDETELALQVAQAVLAQSPDDRAALLIVASAATQLGDPTTGRRAGARAWAVSETDAQKYEAARLTALAAANEERFTLSTFWLRRALTVVPSDAERDRTLRDARAVRQRNPLSLQVSGSLAPSSNVNGGAEDAESTAPGNPTGTLSEDALALEGWRASLSFGAQYRLQESPRSRTTAGLRYQLGRVRITEDTRVPDEAFDTTYYEFNLRHDRALENGTLTFTGSLGTFEYRDLDLASGTTEIDNYGIRRLGMSRQIPVTDRETLSFSVSREWLSYSVIGIGEVDRWIWQASLSHALENGDRVGGSIALTDSNGDIVNYTSTEKTLSLNYSWAKPLILNDPSLLAVENNGFDLAVATVFYGIGSITGPITRSIGGGAKWSDYPDYRLLAPVEGGRQDKTYFLNMNLGFPQIEFAGFSPGLRFDASQADSNVSRFDRSTFSVGLTISSSF